MSIFILNPNPLEADFLSRLCGKFGLVTTCSTPEETVRTLMSGEPRLILIDHSLAAYSLLRGLVRKETSVIITGDDDGRVQTAQEGWPSDYYVDAFILFLSSPAEAELSRAVARALEHARLRREVRDLQSAANLQEAKITSICSELEGIKSLISTSLSQEVEKRLVIESKLEGFHRERQRVEQIVRRVYAANDVSSLLEVVPDIKGIVEAGAVSIYIIDENETLGRYLKPLIWEDDFLPHHELTRHTVGLEAQDFAAWVGRHGQVINHEDASNDPRNSLRYRECLKASLRSLLVVPFRQNTETIGVIEVYNKIQPGQAEPGSFSVNDAQVLSSLSEHISLAMTKLNLIQYDPLTGLLRPDPFYEKVRQKINLQKKRRQEEGACALVMGDVDWFKTYNDRNGHEAGNKLLRELATVLKISIREEDLLCRYGGEEFLFFLTGVKNMEEACQLTERIRQNVEQHCFLFEEFQPLNNLTMSFGVTIIPVERLASTDLLTKEGLKKLTEEADMALGVAKGKTPPRTSGLAWPDQRGPAKNKVCCFTQELADRGQPGAVQAFRVRSYREKRKFARYRATAFLMYKEDLAYRVAKTINLSLGGAKIVSDRRFPLARPLDFWLILGDKASPFRGSVVYSEKANGSPPNFYTGLRFRDLSFDERKSLEDYFTLIHHKEGLEA